MEGLGVKQTVELQQNVIRLLLHIQTKFDNSQAISSLELMSQAKWNMCLKDPGRTANDLSIFVGMKKIKISTK